MSKISALPMVNVGTMSAKALRALVNQFPTERSIIAASTTFMAVKSRNCEDLLTAARVSTLMWHVRARQGLIASA